MWMNKCFFLNHQFWLKIPFPPTTYWFQSRIRSCFSYIQEFRCVKYIYTLVGLQCTRNVRSQPLPQGSLHQGCVFTFSLQLFVKLASGKRDVYSVKSSHYLQSNCYLMPPAGRKPREGLNKSQLSPSDTASRSQLTFISCFKPLWEMCPLMVGPQKHPTARCSLQSLFWYLLLQWHEIQ